MLSWTLMSGLLGCNINLDGDDVHIDEPLVINKVVNRTGATVVLVDRDRWQVSDAFYSRDCAEDILDLNVELSDGVLVLSADDPARHADCRVHVRSDDDMDEVECEGDGDLDHDGTIWSIETITVKGNGNVNLDRVETDRLYIDARGTGEIQIADVQATEVILDMTGTSFVRLGGAADTGDFFVGGTGDLDAQDLILQDLHIELSGEGSAIVTVEDNIDGLLSGTGSLTVFGAPQGEVGDEGEGEIVIEVD